MKKIFLFATALTLCSAASFAQTKTKTTTNPDGFATTKNGLQYNIVKNVPGTNMPRVGDQVEMHIKTQVGDSVLFNSREHNNNLPVPFQVPAPAFKGDITEGFMLMTPGDSALFRVAVDSLKKTGAPLLPWMKSGDMVEYEVVLVSVKTPEQVKKEAEEKATVQARIDDSLIQDYLKKNNIKAVKTASGLYYKINKLGTGLMAATDQQITVNYTGKTLDGNIFDSNVDPKFNHVEPFTFLLGNGRVIKGWDEGLTYFNTGATGTLFIPSGLAYGERSPTPAIPSNGVLIFDVELLHAETPPVRIEKIMKSDRKEDHDHSHGDDHDHQH